MIDVVFGAGPVGLAVVEQLKALGHQVTLATRSGKADAPAGVPVVAADLTVPDQVRALAASADVLYLCASPPYHRWSTEFPPMIDAFIQGVQGTNARFVFADNLYAYGPADGPLTETTAEQPTTVKGKVRRDVVQRLMALNAPGAPRLAVARAADFFGPRVVTSSLGARVFQAVAQGKGAPVLGNIDVPHSYTFIDDFARTLVTLGTRAEAVGHVWHVPSGPARTTREVVTLIAKAYDKPSKFIVAPRWMITLLAPFNSTMREMKEMLYQFEKPFIVDASRFTSTFGDHATPLEAAIQKTVAALPSAPV